MASTWEPREIERITEAALLRDLGENTGKVRFGYYTTAREHLLINILKEIAKIQPDITDHGVDHVRDVLDNAQELLGEKIGELKNGELHGGELNGIELYILILSILFHDVGNIFNREDHRNQISPIYDYARSIQNYNEDSEEKKIILNICEAHCGKGLDGTNNTLKDVIERSKLDRKEVRPNLLAPILRFADELAEGKQRTSHYMIKTNKYPANSILFHQYANCCHVDIDRKGCRIRLTYHIKVRFPDEDERKDKTDDNGDKISIDQLHKLLNFIYFRIEKLDQERQYARYYCLLLEPFKQTTASFNFWYRDSQIPIDLDPVMFSDLIVPGDPHKKVVDRDARYNPSELIESLSKEMWQMDDINPSSYQDKLARIKSCWNLGSSFFRRLFNCQVNNKEVRKKND